MDDPTRQLIERANRLHRDFISLKSEVSHLTNSLENFAHAIESDRASREKAEKTQASIAVTSFRADESIQIKAKPNGSEKKRVWRYSKRALYVIGILAGAGYTFLTWNIWQDQIDATNFMGRQTRLSRNALDVSVRQFQMDQRPFVTVLCCKPDPSPPVEGHPIQFDFEVRNIGKGPAINLQHHQHLVFGEETLRIHADPTDPQRPTEKMLPQLNSPGFVIPTLSVKDTYRQNFDDVKETDRTKWDGSMIAVFGRVTYDDRFGNHYCTPFAHYSGNRGQTWIDLAGTTMKAVDNRNPGKTIVTRHSIPAMCPSSVAPF